MAEAVPVAQLVSKVSLQVQPLEVCRRRVVAEVRQVREKKCTERSIVLFFL